VGLYWQRYGQAGPGMQISGLEEEFQLARARALPRLLWPARPDSGPARSGADPGGGRRRDPDGLAAWTEDPDRDGRLRARR
jgi:hypothetical protein